MSSSELMTAQNGLSGQRSNELVSVVIPVYNRTDLLARAIQSALSQTHKDLEIIVIDDGSDIDIRATVESFHDPRVAYFRHESNMGVSRARNTGIEKSRGKYVAFLDSDDEWNIRKIESQLAAIRGKGQEHKVCYCRMELFDDDQSKAVAYSEYRREGSILNDVLHWNCIGSPSCVMVEKKTLEEVGGFDPNLQYVEDWEMWIRLAERHMFACADDVLVRYHIHHKGRLTDGDPKACASLRKLYEKHGRLIGNSVKTRSLFLYYMGNCLTVNGRKRQGRSYYIRSIALNPLQRDAYKALILSLANRL